jgi:hypothetical protein
MGTRGVAPEDLERFRIALNGAIERSSLRAVAGEVGMSASGLTKFLQGGTPYGKTVQRLHAWYQRAAGLSRVPPEHIAEQLRRLMMTLPEPDRGVMALLETVDRAHRDAGRSPPEWVAHVRSLVRTHA